MYEFVEKSQHQYPKVDCMRELSSRRGTEEDYRREAEERLARAEAKRAAEGPRRVREQAERRRADEMAEAEWAADEEEARQREEARERRSRSRAEAMLLCLSQLHASISATSCLTSSSSKFALRMPSRCRYDPVVLR